MQFTVTKPIHDEVIESLLTDVCHILHDADRHFDRMDIRQEIERNDMASTIKLAKSIAREWDLEVIAGIHGKELRLAFVRNAYRR